MSDTEDTKKSGYRVEYANSARAKCKGPKPCTGTTLSKGELRFGTVVDIRGKTSFAWRHWGCVSPKIIENVKKSFESAEDLDGFDELKEEDQEKLKTAWEVGHVAEEDIPDTAKKVDGDDEEKPRKRAPKKKEAEDGEEEKPKKARGRKPKATEDGDEEPAEKPKASRARKPKKPVSDAEEEEEEKEVETEAEEKPKKKAAPRKKPESKAKPESKVRAQPKARAEPKPKTKAAPKKRATKKDEESSEDFGDEVDGITDEDGEPPAEEAPGQKRKRAPAHKPSKLASRAKRSKPSSSKKQAAEPIEEDAEEE